MHAKQAILIGVLLAFVGCGGDDRLKIGFGLEDVQKFGDVTPLPIEPGATVAVRVVWETGVAFEDPDQTEIASADVDITSLRNATQVDCPPGICVEATVDGMLEIEVETPFGSARATRTIGP